MVGITVESIYEDESRISLYKKCKNHGTSLTVSDSAECGNQIL
jgi:hypothetical protein